MTEEKTFLPGKCKVCNLGHRVGCHWGEDIPEADLTAHDFDPKPPVYWKVRPNPFNITGEKSDTFVWEYPSGKNEHANRIDGAEKARRRRKNRAARQARKVNYRQAC